MQLTDKQKYEIIVRHELKQTNKIIAKEMCINKNTVTKWIHKYAKDNNVDRNEGSGRLKKTNNEQDTEIINEIKNNKLMTAPDVKEEIEKKQINVSVKTVINRLNKYGFSYRKPKEKPFLSDEHKQNRLAWAIKHKYTNWSMIIFSDETSIWRGLGGRKRWVNMNEKDIEKIVKYPMKVHIWGCISKSGIKRIHIFDGIMDSYVYTEILLANILDICYNNPNLVFQDDNDSKHRSTVTNNWKNEYEITSIDWPSNSPDLNPIENVWEILKRKVAKVNISTKEEFIKCIEDKWNEIDQETINNIIDSMPKRINDVINVNGDNINY